MISGLLEGHEAAEYLSRWVGGNRCDSGKARVSNVRNAAIGHSGLTDFRQQTDHNHAFDGLTAFNDR